LLITLAKLSAAAMAAEDDKVVFKVRNIRLLVSTTQDKLGCR
jgi:hypothetical protein